ncbi:MAG: PDZ domain-containing protein [Proteobacteria bacterium]|nr:MAG: PDZ domain-containing protein [Pseudomonadota bacterium]
MRSISFFFYSTLIFLLLPTHAFAQLSLDEIAGRIKQGMVTLRSAERPLRQAQIFDPYYYFYQTVLPQGAKSYPLGTGFIMPDGIHVATSFKQLEGASSIQAVTNSGKAFDAQLLGADASLDLAILRMKNVKGQSGLDFGNSKGSRLGDALYVFGRSIRYLMIKANLSSLDSGEGAFGRHWMIDKPTHPGVSGGPVVDARGRVVGMAGFNPDGPAQLGVVLPSALILKGAEQLIRNGKLSKAWMGIVPKNLASLDDLDHLRSNEIKGGVLVENLIVDGPAAKAGLQIGDFILAIGEKTLLQTADLNDFLDRHKAGESVSLKIHRAGKGLMKLSLQLGDLPSAQDLPNASSLL